MLLGPMHASVQLGAHVAALWLRMQEGYCLFSRGMSCVALLMQRLCKIYALAACHGFHTSESGAALA